ncbi:hypothetical protein [Paraglaciecola sp. L3A3]|uniref:hypothetical protein n=1 Tax=Paraglaciecola sp. L3A3 TaxID=2686358 RepID=UPI00131B4B9A|nr:hypothetical protein [Paraglaciecola sp. L3A3]
MKLLFLPFLSFILIACNSAQQSTISTQQKNVSQQLSTPDNSGYPASLMWKNGVPVLTVNRPEDKHLRGFNQDKTILVWQAGQHQVEVNPIEMEFHFSTTKQNKFEALSFQVLTTNDKTYSLKLQLPPELDHAFPIRFIETGNWYQYISFHEFSLVPDNNVEQIINIEGHLDWKAWHNSGSISLSLNPTKNINITSIKPVWKNNDKDINTAVTNFDNQAYTLTMSYHLTANQKVQWFNLQPSPVTNIKISSDHATATFEPTSNAWEIQLPEIEKTRAQSKTSPEVLDKTTTNSFSLANDSAEEQTVNLRFIHPRHSQTGFVPILRDNNGIQTGWPIQVSKNWHIRKGRPRLTNDGGWSHTSLSLKVPAKSNNTYTYEIVHANWNGVPAASVAQLSLVGWGGNGFWLEAALGNWSEHFCFQPGRALRRSMITDIRPLFQKGMNNKKDDDGYNWTSNVGGGDTGLLHDRNGRYIPWKQARTEFHSLGPILSEVSIEEITSDDSAKLRSTFIIPRSDDLNRAYIKLEFEVLKPFDISRLALFQFGNDYYASGHSLSVKYGQGDSLTEKRTRVNGIAKSPKN